MVNKDFH